MLLKAGASGFLVDYNGNNILYYAVKYKKYQTIKFIYDNFGYV